MTPSMDAFVKLLLTVLLDVVNILEVLPIASNIPYKGHTLIKIFQLFWHSNKRRAQLWL